MTVYESFAEIADRFSTLLVDAYGVFWDGGGFYPGSLETLSDAVRRGKRVCVLSNTTSPGADSVRTYAKRGMLQGVHYTDFVTSGDVLRKAVLEEKIDIPGRKIYMWGTPRGALFADSAYRLVDDASAADAFYISIPQLTDREKANYPEFEDEFFLSRLSPDDDHRLWDTLTEKPFAASLREMLRHNLPALCANPDFRAFEKPKTGGEPRPVIRQGAVAEMYRRMGGRVVEFGKPHANIYQYAFAVLGIAPSPQVAMIGDTFRTDIAGALHAGISAVWCIETGMSRYEKEKGVSLEKQSGGAMEKVFLIKSLGGKTENR